MRVRLFVIRLIDFVFGLVAAFLGLRFVLKLFGANAANGFVGWVYDMSGVLLEPFRGIFPTETFERAYVLEFSTLFAVLAYGLLYLLLVVLINALTPHPEDEVASKDSRAAKTT